MDTPLEHIRTSIKEEYSRLSLVDGLTPDQLAEIMGYENPGMVYAIQNPNKNTSYPPLDKHLLLSQRLSKYGNLRLWKMGGCGLYEIRKREGAFVNGTVQDEHCDLSRAAVGFMDAYDTGDHDAAERMLQQMDACLTRYRAELAARKGEAVRCEDVAVTFGGDGADAKVSR